MKTPHKIELPERLDYEAPYYLKECPFCGEPYFVMIGAVHNPLAWSDQSIRGEACAFVMCAQCNAVVKGQTFQEAVDGWNKRAGDKREEGEEDF